MSVPNDQNNEDKSLVKAQIDKGRTIVVTTISIIVFLICGLLVYRATTKNIDKTVDAAVKKKLNAIEQEKVDKERRDKLPAPIDPVDFVNSEFHKPREGEDMTNLDGREYMVIIRLQAKPVDASNPEKPIALEKMSFDEEERIKNGVKSIRREIVLNSSVNPKNRLEDLRKEYNDWKSPASAAAKTLNAKLFMSYQIKAPIPPVGGETWFKNDVPENKIDGYFDGFFSQLIEAGGNHDKIANVILKQKMSETGK